MLGKGTFVIDLDFKPRGVCARMIHVELSDDGSTIENVAFDGGCNGNLKAIGRLVAGQPVDSIVELCRETPAGRVRPLVPINSRLPCAKHRPRFGRSCHEN